MAEKLMGAGGDEGRVQAGRSKQGGAWGLAC
jgi:hypothetical protein